MSHFDQLEMQPPDPIFGILPLFNADTNPEKINLSVGTYKDNNGKPQVFTSVVKAEKNILEQNLNKEYLPIDGDPLYSKLTAELVFGMNSAAITHQRVYTCQTIGGSGALKLGAEFLHQAGFNKIYVSNPTWTNHLTLFSNAGLPTEYYSYYDPKIKDLNFNEMCSSIEKIPDGSVILLHASCHNPTGLDPTADQWRTLSQLIKRKQILPFFDFAYQGFKDNVEDDAFAVRLFVEDGHENLLVANSYSKNFGLYGERMGALSIVTSNKEQVPIVGSHIKRIIRTIYSSPPLHGARIIGTVLNDPSLKAEWLNELHEIKERIWDVRKKIVHQLTQKGYGERYKFMNKQCGMFCYMGIDKEQVRHLREKNGIYMLDNSRINVAGLNKHNLDYFIQALITASN